LKIAMVSEQVHDVSALSDALRRRGHEVTADAPTALPHLGDFIAGLRDRWSATPPDVVHTHFWTSGLAGALAARDLGVPVVHSCHGLGIAAAPGDRASDRLDVERLLAREAALLIASCPSEASDLTRLGVRRARLRVIPAGVDTGTFTPDGPRARRTLPYRVVAFGELRQDSGLREIVSALPTLEDTELVVVCEPGRTGGDGEREMRELRALAREHGVSGRVVRTERRSRSLPSLLRSADVVLDLPWYDRSGSSALEAMACGIPVIATPVGGLLDAVVDGVTGRYVPTRSPGVLARTLRLLLDNEVERYEFGIAARDRVTARYTWDRVAESTVRAYESAGSGIPSPRVTPEAAGTRPHLLG
jgi:D-inositol-3-phosphate glycosyltransferase